MRKKAVQLSLFLASSLMLAAAAAAGRAAAATQARAEAEAAQPVAQPLVSLPNSIVMRLPERYRAALAAGRFPPEWIVDNPDRDPRLTFRSLALRLARTSLPLRDFLTSAYGEESDAGYRRAIVHVIAQAGLPGEDVESLPFREADKAFLRRVAASDPDVALSTRAADAVRFAAQIEIRAALRTRLQTARSANDVAAQQALRDALDRNNYGDVTLPRFAYRPPPLFAAAPADEARIRALVFGDFGTGTPAQISTAAAMRSFHRRSPFTFGLTTGDNFYQSGLDDPLHPRWTSEWENLYSPMGIRFYPTFGNHDMSGDSPAAELARTAHSDSWEFPAPYYTYTAGPVQFFAIDTVRMSDAQLEWLDRELRASRATWKIVYGHYQMFSATRGDFDGAESDLIGRLLPIMTRNQVDAYICGHDHNLQELRPVDGVHFFVIGAGGAGLYDLDDDYPRTVYQSREHGFGVLEATAETLTISLVGLNGSILHQRAITASARARSRRANGIR